VPASRTTSNRIISRTTRWAWTRRQIAKRTGLFICVIFYCMFCAFVLNQLIAPIAPISRGTSCSRRQKALECLGPQGAFVCPLLSSNIEQSMWSAFTRSRKLAFAFSPPLKNAGQRAAFSSAAPDPAMEEDRRTVSVSLPPPPFSSVNYPL
jgi:hypothetical protein